MSNHTASASAVVSFVTQLGLSASDVVRVSTALESATVFASVGLLVLSLLYPHLTFWPGTSSYTVLQQVNWSKRAWLPAALIFTPDSTGAVSTGVKVAVFFNIEFSVRGGGHMHFPGAASSDGGLLIAMDELTGLSLDERTGVVSIGPGNRWINVYDFLEPYGLATVGGRVPGVGVAGLITGGGNSFYSTAYGMACDMVESFEVVLASGKVVIASAKQNPDLFKALKGGGNNFGIVTRFNLLTVPQTNGVWGGSLFYTPDKYEGIIDAIVRYQDKHQIEDPKAGMIQTAVFAGGQAQGWLSTIFHADTDSPVSLQDWKTLAPIWDTTSRSTLAKVVKGIFTGSGAAPVMRQHMATLSIGVDAELYKQLLAHFTTTWGAVGYLTGLMSTLTYQPMAVSTVRRGKEMGGNVLGVDEVAQVWLALTTSWANAADDAVVISTAVGLIDDMAAMAEKKGLLMRNLYLNDAAADQDVINSYGRENVKFLKKVAKKYDPDAVFQTLSRGGFKLP